VSALQGDKGGILNVLVEAQRGMSPAEIKLFLTTGQEPDLSQPPLTADDFLTTTEVSPSDVVMSEDEAVQLLSGQPIVAGANFFILAPSHDEILHSASLNESLNIVAASKWIPDDHPRDRRGRFIEKGALLDFLATKKPTVQDVSNAVDELTKDSWQKLTDDQQSHIQESIAKLPTGSKLRQDADAKLTQVAGAPVVQTTPATPTAIKKRLTPATIYKKHTDGAVIAESADGSQRMRWDEGRKKFIVERRDGDAWVEQSALTKTAAYSEVRNPDKWFEPTELSTEVKPTETSPAPKLDLTDTSITAETPKISPAAAPTPTPTPTPTFTPTSTLQKQSVDSYRLGGFTAVNRQLRTGQKQKLISMDTDDLIKGLDEAMSENVTDKDQYLWRGLNVSPGDLTAGAVLEDKAFLSTSKSRAQAEHFALSPPDINAIGEHKPVLMNIKVPAGSRALDFGGGEQEVLLDRNSKLKITNVFTGKNGITMVNAELVRDVPADAEIPEVADTPHVIPSAPKTVSVNAPSAPQPVALTAKTPITPTKAVYAKTIADGDVIAESALGDQRWRWDASQKKFALETRGVAGNWTTSELLTKKSTYDRVKSGNWFEPVQDGQTSEPLEPPQTPELPEPLVEPTAGVPTTSAPNVTNRVAGRDVEAEVKQHLADWRQEIYDSGDNGEDTVLKHLAELQGWDELPRLGSSADLDAAIAAGGIEAWRGVTGGDEKAVHKNVAAATGLTSTEIIDKFKKGPVYYGTGIFGNGIYAGNRNVAMMYANENPAGVARMVIDPAARIIDGDALETEYIEWVKQFKWSDPEAAVLGDLGRFAAMRGYDVISQPVPGKDKLYHIILNRSALLIEDPAPSGGQ
jgi:hypothetical protein